MKKYIFIILLTFTFVEALYGAEETNINDPCNTIMAFQPQSKNILSASSVMNIYMTLSACTLKDKIKLKPSQYIWLISFSHTQKGHMFEYEITTFGKGTLINKQICKTSSHYEHPPGSSLATMIEIFSTPECIDKSITQQ